jgi:hypothetical protein
VLSLHQPGFVVDSEAEAVRAVTRLGEIDRLQVRVCLERRFIAKRMAADYVAPLMKAQSPRSSQSQLSLGRCRRHIAIPATTEKKRKKLALGQRGRMIHSRQWQCWKWRLCMS